MHFYCILKPIGTVKSAQPILNILYVLFIFILFIFRTDFPNSLLMVKAWE